MPASAADAGRQGQPFKPDAPTRAILDHAAKIGCLTSRVIGFQETVRDRSFRVYPDRRWINPIADGTPANPGGPFDLSWRRTSGGYRDLDTRIWFFTDYYPISPGMISQTPGKGAKYIADTDDEARFLASSGRQSFASLRSGRPIQLPPPSKEWERDLRDSGDPFGGRASRSPARRVPWPRRRANS